MNKKLKYFLFDSSWLIVAECPVSDLPLCLGVLKHMAPLARGGGGIFLPKVYIIHV